MSLTTTATIVLLYAAATAAALGAEYAAMHHHPAAITRAKLYILTRITRGNIPAYYAILTAVLAFNIALIGAAACFAVLLTLFIFALMMALFMATSAMHFLEMVYGLPHCARKKSRSTTR